MSLSGKRIVITRPEAQTRPFVAILREAGAVPIIFPTIAIVPIEHNTALDNALRRLRDYDWVIFTSANGVHISLERMQTLGIPLTDLGTRQIAVIGPATAATLQHYGLSAALQPDEYIAEAIVTALQQRGPIAGQRFLLLRADIARQTLHEQLIAHQAIVDEIPVYQTVRGQPDAAAFAELRAGVDVITFTSSSTVRYFFALLGNDALTIAANALIACIGPITARTAREFGLNVDLVAEEYTIPGLVTSLTERVQ